ncbi:MAG: enoyl-CoA hydratase-related protein [Bryobacterales bacterium]|nr:enoyl-CoA hydratase-related protein [Bryobacterales bacterium]
MQSAGARLDRSGCVATITLDRPETRNALDAGTVDELSGHLRSIAADPDVRVVELAAAGTCFSAGADLRAMRSMGAARVEQNLGDSRRFVEMLRLLHSLSKPTVARVQGAAIGGGVGLVACCDIAVASDEAFFRLSEVQLGLVPAMVGPYLIEALGVRMAKRLMLTGERIDARKAAQWGLVHEVVAPDQLAEATGAVIRRLLRGAPGALATCKALVAEISDRPLDDALRKRTAQILADRRSSEEGRAGVRSFLDKSRPPWARAAAIPSCDR